MRIDAQDALSNTFAHYGMHAHLLHERLLHVDELLTFHLIIMPLDHSCRSLP